MEKSASTPRPKSTAALIAVGTAWFMLMRWSLRLIGLFSTVVLARLLVPEDFGLVAIATGYLSVLDTITELGARTALIRHDAADREFSHTVFTLQVARGSILALVVVASSFILPSLVHDQRLEPVIWCLALSPLVTGFMNPEMAFFERQLDFRRESALQVTAKILSALTSITIAIVYRTYWALVAGLLVQAFARVALSYILSPYSPRFGLKSWRTLFHFSGWLTLSYMFDAIGHGMDNILVGAFLGIRAAGIFTMAEQLATMPLGEFLPVITRTLFPGLLRFRGEPEKLRANALHTLGMLVAVSVPMAAGFCAVSPEVVRVLYGKAWIDAIPLVQILALAAGVESIGGAVANSVVLASGKTTYLFRRGLLLVLIRLPAVILGLWLFGMKGALAGYLLGAVTLSVVNLVTLCELLNAGAKDLIREFWITFVAVALMAGALFAVGREFQPSFDFELNIAALAVKMVVGVAVYTAARFVLWQVSGRPPGIEARGLALAVSARGLILSKLATPHKVRRD